MRIKKVSKTTATSAQVVDGYSESTTDTYSCNYINEMQENIENSIKALYDDLFFKPGDVYNVNTVHCAGFITSSTKNVSFTFFLPKRMDNVNSVTVTAGTIVIRGIAGYVDDTYNNPINLATTTMGKAFYIANSNTIRISVSKSSVFENATNNTPVAVATSGLVLSFS